MTDRPIALITGASSGIGAAMALTLARAGYDLVLAARRRDRLQEFAVALSDAGAASEVVPVDLSERAGIQHVADRAASGDIDVLVSNAGVSAYGPFAEIAPEDLDSAWTLNADATMFLARAALPGMLDRGRGGIITVASMLAYSAGAPAAAHGKGPSLPKRAIYVGAKAGIVAFTRVLASELDGTGVRATVVCPGLVSSEWNAGASRVPNAMTPEDVAHAAWTGFSRGEVVCLPGLEELDALDRLASAELAIMSGAITPTLAGRYRS